MSVFAETAEDLATLARLDEQVLVDQLRLRYDNSDIYVRPACLDDVGLVTGSMPAGYEWGGRGGRRRASLALASLMTSRPAPGL